MTRGFYVGRFQPFHEGHRRVVEHVVDGVDELVVGIGSAGRSHHPDDPFTGGERVQMITRAVEDLDPRTYVVPIEDIERNAVWVSHVRSMCPAFDVVYSNNPLVVRLFEEAGVPVRVVPMYDRDRLEGTKVRARMREGGDWEALVPDPVAAVVRDVDGVERLRAVSADDTDPGGDAGTGAESGGASGPGPEGESGD